MQAKITYSLPFLLGYICLHYLGLCDSCYKNNIDCTLVLKCNNQFRNDILPKHQNWVVEKSNNQAGQVI